MSVTITAPQAVIVSVTTEHIAAGKREDCERCPIAPAFAEVFPGSPYIDEFSCMITDDDGTETEFDLPDEALEFIRAFDDGEDVAPFTFIATPAVTDGAAA
jgi:hypothetical protein